MPPTGHLHETIILSCPSCATKVAVPAAARGHMAKCVKCAGTFPIPLDDEHELADEGLADDIALEVLEQEDKTDDATVVMESLQEDDETEPAASKVEPPVQLTPIQQAEAMVDLDPPDIGDASTPQEVKQLRRERHKLLLEVGREAHRQILSSSLQEFQARIKKADKNVRRLRAWLEAIVRASAEDNPLAKRIDLNVDPSKATKQLAAAIEAENHAFRVLGEALIRLNQHPRICTEHRERIQAIEEKLDELMPAPPRKKGLLSRLRRKS